LPIARYDAKTLGGVLGNRLDLIETFRHEHKTPWGAVQSFQFNLFRRTT
jgi:hypothetical protein